LSRREAEQPESPTKGVREMYVGGIVGVLLIVLLVLLIVRVA
jgi:hypothetical protein